VTYRKVGEELWFPATWTIEGSVQYKRNVTMGVTGNDFRKTRRRAASVRVRKVA
jgi:hypothetical protein